MNKCITLFVFLFFSNLLISQSRFEGIKIQTLNGLEIDLESTLKHKKDKPVILFTWAKKWCTPCVSVLADFDSKYYKNLRDNYGLKFVALNLDSEVKTDEIKEYTIGKKWYFDNYQDPEGHYLKKLDMNSAPEIYLIVNNKIVKYKKGFVKMSDPNSTAKYMSNLVKQINSRKVLYDSDWNVTSSSYSAKYVRYIDPISSGKYQVHDRWIKGGELQMTGTYLDKFCSIKDGVFTYYYKEGWVSQRSTYVNNQLHGISTHYYNATDVSTKLEYKNGSLWNILSYYSKYKKSLYYGTLKDGNGTVYFYTAEGTKTRVDNVKNGYLHGKRTYYDKNGQVTSQYLYENGKLVKEIK